MSKENDLWLRHAIEAELKWDSEIDSRRIAVATVDGVVTLSGHARSYFEKWRAEKAAKRIRGVGAIANEIDVRLAGADRRDDTAIAASALKALHAMVSIPPQTVHAIVSKGVLTLQGEVDRQFQKDAAEAAVRELKGVYRVSNEITVRYPVQSHDVKASIEAALKRSAEADSEHLVIQANDGNVTLSGKLRSWAEHDDAVHAAWATPGVSRVIDFILVQ